MQRDWLRIKAPAKINLHLKITGKRPDGYHTLETVMQKVALYDEIGLRLGRGGIRLSCPGQTVAEDRTNLAFRAAERFFDRFAGQLPAPDAGVEIVLEKRIPVAAGLGGGSSDAAAVLKGLDWLCGTRCTPEALAGMGLELGADVPFFLADAAAVWATGIGEVLAPVASLKGFSVLLVNPGFSVSTQWAYQTFSLTQEVKTSILKYFPKEGVWSWRSRASTVFPLDGLENDLETVTAVRHSEIGQLKRTLMDYGAQLALMSGSGPTVFGLFADPHQAATGYAILQRQFDHTYLVPALPDEA